MTHAAMLSGKWRNFVANDITDVPKLFKDAIDGKYANEERWISREDFVMYKDSDPYIRTCWSFGNGGRTYLYSREIEPFKRALHRMLFADTVEKRALAWRKFVAEFDRLYREIDELTQKGLDLCKECEVEPIYNVDGTLAAEKVKNAVFKAKSADMRAYLREALEESGKTQSDVGRHLGNQMSRHYFGDSQWLLPTAEQYEKLQEILPTLTRPYGQLKEQLQSLQSLQSLERLQILQSLESLERLQSLERLERLQSLERLTISQKDYREVEIPDGATVYCDPPYINTGVYGKGEYGRGFSHDEFYDWLRSRDYPVYVSEYTMPEDFAEVASIGKSCSMSATNKRMKVTERLFVHERFAERAAAVQTSLFG